jgi:hypothetical protein
MACTALLAPVAMATTQFARKIGSQVSTTRQSELNNRLNSPRMNWVVVTGQKGARRVRMHWITAADCSGLALDL